MAGKGRGRGKYTFNLEVIGIGKGEALPSSSLAPPPLFPPLPVKTAPFCPSKSDHYNYLHDVKQELNSAFKSSKYFLVPPKVNLGIQRYSDKFAGSSDSPPKQTAESLVDWRLMPEGLRLKGKTKQTPKKKQSETKKIDEILKKFDESEEVDEEKEKESQKDEVEEGEEDDEVEKGDDDERNEEEDNDYLDNYFDNGEGYEQDSDEYEEGPTY